MANQALAGQSPRFTTQPHHDARLTLPRPSFGEAVVLLLLAVVTIEAMLALRVWVQLSGDELGIPALRLLYSLSSIFVEPFRGLETTTPIESATVLELATIVASLAYLMGAAMVFALFVVMRALLSFTTRRVKVSAAVTRRPARVTEPA